MCRTLLDRGDEVVCVDNYCTGSAVNVAPLLDNDAFELIEADICDGLDIDGDVHGVMNLASPASPKDYFAQPLATMRVGSLGTNACLDLAHAKGARILQASTSEIYGDPLEHPQTEGYWGNVNPIGVRSVYDEAKRFGEALCASYEREYGLTVRIARIFNTYGPGMQADDGRVVSNFVVQALRGEPLTVFGDGLQTRSFCYVSDEIAGLLALYDSDVAGPVNVGNPDEFTVLELAQIVAEVAGVEVRTEHLPLPSDDPVRRRPDITRARTELGWAPSVGLRHGVERTMEWFRAQLETGA